jgi:hypothetical protein
MVQIWATGLALAAAFMPSLAFAQSDIVGEQAWDARVDLRTSVVGGEQGWLDGGFGKLRYGGDGGETQPRLKIASADIAWKPQFTFSLSGLLSVTHQDGQSPGLDLSEAWLKWRSGPGATRFSARAGLMWPPISQEHGGSTWDVEDSITPSAANSWVGEEIKVLAFEANIEQRIGEHTVELTAAAFRHNDMSGTVLTFRGWALHDLKVTANGDLPLPALPPPNQPYQDTITTPLWEVDGKTGYYARLDWRPPLPVSLNVLRYDNLGDRVSSRDKQTSWRTRFWNIGAMAQLGDRTVAKAQAMWGNTLVGPDTPYGIPGDVDFATAYFLVSRTLGVGKLTLRGDWFETRDKSFVDTANNDEHGWAAMAAYKRPLADFAEALVELIHVDSERPARALYGTWAADQSQTMLQLSLRLHI